MLVSERGQEINRTRFLDGINQGTSGWWVCMAFLFSNRPELCDICGFSGWAIVEIDYGLAFAVRPIK